MKNLQFDFRSLVAALLGMTALLKIKTPPTHWVRGDQFATLAVIGTLRPTDRRRAFIGMGRNIPIPAQKCYASGAEGDRTPDLCSAIAALSQLSYSPYRES
jgi:hypothetical protein